MPLIQPDRLREKILLIAPGKTGKTSCWLSIAWWAHQSGDTRKFYVLDTDDEAVYHVMNEDKYKGMLAEEGGHVHVHRAAEWEDYVEFGNKAMVECGEGDWIVIDFISHAWEMVQTSWLHNEVKKTRSEALLDASRQGLTGWDMFRTDFNWPVINSMYFDWLKPLTIKSRAHLFWTAEQDEIQERNKMSDADKEHLQKFGKYKAVGQKKLPFQCRSYLRLQRLARGRVLFTQGDRARPEYNGDTMSPDFFSFYLKAAGWKVE